MGLITCTILAQGVCAEIVDITTELLGIFRSDREVSFAVKILTLFPHFPLLEGGDVVGIIIYSSHLRLHGWLKVDGETGVSIRIVIPGWIGDRLTILHEEEIDGCLWGIATVCLHVDKVAETVHQHTTHIFLIHT